MVFAFSPDPRWLDTGFRRLVRRGPVRPRQLEAGCQPAHGARPERNGSAVQVRHVPHDGQAEARAGNGLIPPHATLEHELPRIRVESRAVVFNRQDQPPAQERRRDHDPRTCPLARIVEQVAEHLVEILAPPFEEMTGIDPRRDVEPAMRVELPQGPYEPVDRIAGATLCVDDRSRCSGARVRQVIVDLSSHQRQLLSEHLRKIRIAVCRETVSFVRQDRKRRFEAVRQIARFGDRPGHHLLAVRQEPVEVVHERLHFGGIPASKVVRRAVADVGQPPPHLVQREECRTYDRKARNHAPRRDPPHQPPMGVDDADGVRETRVQRYRDCRDGKKAGRSEHGSQHDSSAKRPHGRGSVSYTVSLRTTEVGVRIALGATARRVMTHLVAQNLAIVVVGGLVGWLISFVVALDVAGVETLDVSVFAGVPLLLMLVAAAACWLRAWRATRVNPMVAMRQE